MEAIHRQDMHRRSCRAFSEMSEFWWSRENALEELLQKQHVVTEFALANFIDIQYLLDLAQASLNNVSSISTAR